MAIKDVYNSVSSGVANATKPLSQLFGGPLVYERPATTPKQSIKQAMIDPTILPSAIRHLESSGGMDPNTPRNQNRQFIIPAANQNEATRTIPYNVGFGGEYGLTPVALAELAKSRVDKAAPVSTHTKYGPPVIKGRDPREIQQKLNSVEGAGQLAMDYFLMKKGQNKDFSPDTLANDYINNYVGRGTPGDTPTNRVRVLNYFRGLAQ